MIGVALVGFITIFAASAKASINGAVDTTTTARSSSTPAPSAESGGISHDAATDLATRPEFDAVTSARLYVADIAGDDG